MELINNCNICNVVNTASNKDLFDDNEINKIIKGIFNKQITISNMDVDAYEKIASHLTEGVYEGFGKKLINVKYGTPDYKMLASLRENVYVFSGAKSYQTTKAISALLTDSDRLVPYNEFKKKATEEFTKFNTTYLNVEYNSAIAQARSASQWQTIVDDSNLYNQLQYETVGDARVRDDHKVLDGIVRPVNDKFWTQFMPPNGWNCRCTVLQTTDVKNTNLSGKQKPSLKDVTEIFRFNAGLDKIIFSKAHPYFHVAKKDKALARANFNLPLPQNKNGK